MALDKVLLRAFTLDELIKEQKTGTAQELAEKLGISVTQTRQYIYSFNRIGKENRFNGMKRSYVYLDQT